MRYYFFITSLENRGGNLKPTLRPLPGQTFDDGTPIDTGINVQAPKEKGTSPYGNRLDYPEGTVFCSDYLGTDLSKRTMFYTVYKDIIQQPNFHPVSDDPSFNYVSPEHKSDVMNAAYLLFKTLGTQEMDTEETTAQQELQTTELQYSPADANGIANEENPAWKPRYVGQLEVEATMFTRWLSAIFAEKKIKPASRILMTAEMPTFEKLYRMGESIDTIASRTRFELFIAKEKISISDFSIMAKGPHTMYLAYLLAEHEGKKMCTSVERNPDNQSDINDAYNIIFSAHSDLTGAMLTGDADTDKSKLKKAIASGWTLDQLVEPERLSKADTFSQYIDDIASGKIELPVTVSANGKSYIDTLMADKQNRKPKDSEGFHVDDTVWKLLVRNYHKRVNTLIIGDTGSGKTQLVKLLAERMGANLTIIPMGTITDPTTQLVGKMDLDSVNGGNVAMNFDWADFAIAIQKPGIVLLDEVNRIPKNGENILFNVLDDIRELSASGAKSTDNRTIKVHPDCAFFATANIGTKYTGTKPIDAALENRFSVKIPMDYMCVADETKILVKRCGISKEDAMNIATVAADIRMMARKDELQNTVSTRETLSCSELVADGFSVKDALEIVILPLYDNGYGNSDANSERAKIKSIIQKRFNVAA